MGSWMLNVLQHRTASPCLPSMVSAPPPLLPLPHRAFEIFDAYGLLLGQPSLCPTEHRPSWQVARVCCSLRVVCMHHHVRLLPGSRSIENRWPVSTQKPRPRAATQVPAPGAAARPHAALRDDGGDHGGWVHGWGLATATVVDSPALARVVEQPCGLVCARPAPRRHAARPPSCPCPLASHPAAHPRLLACPPQAPIFRADLFQGFARPSLWDAFTGWGLDFVWCAALRCAGRGGAWFVV